MEGDVISLRDMALRLAAVMFLVLANGFFVASEFALVGARRTRLETLVRRGGTRARYALEATSHLDHYISGTQLGITLASLGLGWIGETTIAALLIQVFQQFGEPLSYIASHVVAGTIAFAFITFLHIVLGELAPKSVALLFPEGTSLATAGPLIWFSRITAPFIALLNGTANLLLRMVGLRSPTEMERVHRPEEIEMILDQMHEHKQIGKQPVEMIRGVFHLGSRTAAEIMTPRTEIVGLEQTVSVPAAAARFLETGFSRLPVYEQSIDRIVGVVLAHDVWRAREQQKQDLAELIRPVPFVPDTKPLEKLLEEMRKARVHLVIVLDEFGGTHGIVTMEDVVEEVIGEISDEDEPAVRELESPAQGVYLVQGDYGLADLRDELGVDLPSDDATTVAGFIMNRLGRLPMVGDVVNFRGGEFTVRVMRGRRVLEAELRRAP